MSAFAYNGVSLPYPYHTSFSQGTVMDDSGTDKLYTQTDLTVQCVINTDYAGVLGVGAGLNPAGIMTAIRAKLLEPRKTLSVTFNGTQLIPGNPAGNAGTVDAKNGPIPQFCNYTLLTNTTFLMSYRIIHHAVENPSGTAPSTALSVRWAESIDLDAGSYGTRSRNGVVIISSSNPKGQQADAIRTALAVCGIPQGFKRESAAYTVSPDGLALRFAIVDKEQFYMPPEPAYDADGYYEESTTHLGAQRWGQCSVSLKGSKTVQQNQLIQTAVGVCASKLLINGAQVNAGNGQFSRLDQAIVRISMYRNECSVTLRALMNPNRQEVLKGVAGIYFARMAASPLGSEPPTFPPIHDETGTSQFLLQAAAYFDSSLDDTLLDRRTGQLNRGQAPGTAGK